MIELCKRLAMGIASGAWVRPDWPISTYFFVLLGVLG